MTIYFVTFANEKYKKKQLELIPFAKSLSVPETRPVIALAYDAEALKYGLFYKEYEHILSQERGCGYWLWKPYLIYQTLEMCENESDVVFYLDCGDKFTPELLEYAQASLKDKDCLLLKGGYPNKDWTKRDCFVMMNCDEEKYWNVTQLEAGVQFWRATKRSKEIVREWLAYACNENILTDIPNKCGLPNFENFQDHRHDQSILTNLALKYNLPIDFGTMRQFVVCNY